MGTAAWKHQVDMYLYYELGGWSPFLSPEGYRAVAKPDGLTPTMDVVDMVRVSS